MPAPSAWPNLPAAFLAAALLAAGAAQASAAAAPVTAALVIGNAHYTGVGTLNNAQNDATDMCVALGSIGFRTSCFVDIDSRLEMRAVIEDFVDSLPRGAVSVIYYAGHGLQVHGENYLVPTGAHLTDEVSVPQATVSLSFLMRQVQRHEGYLTVVILDACRNNPLAHAGRPLPAGLAQITDIPEATQVVYATAANQPAIDGTGRNGTFTAALLGHLKEPGTIDDLFRAVTREVQHSTASLAHPQRPALYTNFGGQYCLVHCTTLEEMSARAGQAEASREAAAAAAAAASGARREGPPQTPARPAKPFVPPVF